MRNARPLILALLILTAAAAGADQKRVSFGVEEASAYGFEDGLTVGAGYDIQWRAEELWIPDELNLDAWVSNTRKVGASGGFAGGSSIGLTFYLREPSRLNRWQTRAEAEIFVAASWYDVSFPDGTAWAKEQDGSPGLALRLLWPRESIELELAAMVDRDVTVNDERIEEALRGTRSYFVSLTWWSKRRPRLGYSAGVACTILGNGQEYCPAASLLGHYRR